MAIHVYPAEDWIDHRTEQNAADCDCPCEPRIEWQDEGGELLSEPLIIHNALDGRA